MGIKQFYQIIIKNPKSIYNDKPIHEVARETTLAKLKGSTVCVDASGEIYRAILAMAHVNQLSHNGKTTAHINNIFNKVIQINAAGIRQIWVFDSPILNPLKEDELKKRRARAYASSDPKVQFRMSGEHVQDIKNLLQTMGIPWIEAPSGIEAEQYGAWMTQGSRTQRFCHYMLSGDSDVLGFGGNLLRPVSKKSSTGKSSRTVYEIYERDIILEELGLNNDEFMTLATAMGTDFNPKVVGVGIKTIVEKVRESKITRTAEMQTVVDYFMSKPNYNQSELKTSFPQTNVDDVVKFLTGVGFKEDRVRTRMKKFKQLP